MNAVKAICIVLATAMCVLALTSCKSDDLNRDGVPDYFLEPDGCVIATIEPTNQFAGGFFCKRIYYGYIDKGEYEKFMARETDFLCVLHPYEEGKSVYVDRSAIKSISIGDYVDYRGC